MSRKPILVFDGDCGFCRLWIERWCSATGDRVEYEPYQTAAARFPRVPRERFTEAVHLFEPGGRDSRGAEAALRALSHAPGASWLPRAYALPGFAFIAEAIYRFIADRRVVFSRLTRLLWGESAVPAPVDRAARLVLSGIGACYLVAFVSFGVQVRGLIGAEGIIPAASMLEAAKAQLGPARFWTLPTLAWLASSDAALSAFCWLGAALSFGLLLGVAAAPCALACWALYLSLSTVGFDFMSFQWDALLLEAGVIACFLPSPSGKTGPSRGALRLMRLLLVKLMIQSGLVKILSHDPSWRDLTALSYHYWTQPLPTPLAWWAARLPLWAHKATCAGMFAVELGAPLLIFLPRKARALGAGAIVALMLGIAATGNYGFFNLLALVLGLACLDDRLLFKEPAGRAPRTPRPAGPARGRVVAAFGVLWLLVSGIQTAAMLGVAPAAPARALLAAVYPARSINHYGLFAVMTKNRDEIALEVSLDGREWREWPFLYKAGDPRRAPPIVAPHMPRLDWQMWFAALGEPGSSPWFANLLYRVLQGSPAVAALLGPNPFGSARPVYARAFRYATTFSSREERRADGAWWRRARTGLLVPVVTLKR